MKPFQVVVCPVLVFSFLFVEGSQYISGEHKQYLNKHTHTQEYPATDSSRLMVAVTSTSTGSTIGFTTIS
jgi:hypothetical protein